MGWEEDGTFIYVCYIRAFTVDEDGDAASLMVLWLHPDPAAPGVRWLHCAEDPGWKNSSGQDVLADWIHGPVYVRAFGAPLFEPGASLSWCICSEADLVCMADFASPLPNEAGTISLTEQFNWTDKAVEPLLTTPNYNDTVLGLNCPAFMMLEPESDTNTQLQYEINPHYRCVCVCVCVNLKLIQILCRSAVYNQQKDVHICVGACLQRTGSSEVLYVTKHSMKGTTACVLRPVGEYASEWGIPTLACYPCQLVLTCAERKIKSRLKPNKKA